jgi:ElaB/YqjD/DUF883 family membrane-anchored ribosome-binding protein
MEKVHSVDASKDQLIADLKAVVHSGEDLLAATASQSGEKIAEIRARAQTALQGAREKLAAAQDEVVARAKVAAHATDEYVHENPWTAVGVGAAVGFLLGMLISRR